MSFQFLTQHRNLNHTKQRLLEVANYVDQVGVGGKRVLMGVTATWAGKSWQEVAGLEMSTDYGAERRGCPWGRAQALWHILSPSSAWSRPQILRTLDIQVALTGLEVWTEQDRSHITSDANATLWAFLQWRRGLWARWPHDSTQLLTWVPSYAQVGPRLGSPESWPHRVTLRSAFRGRAFQGATVGLAPIEGMCRAESSGGVSTVSSTRDRRGE